MNKIYRVNKSARIFVTSFFIFMVVLGILFLKYNALAPFLQRLVASTGIVFFSLSIVTILKIKVIIDDNGIGIYNVNPAKLFNWGKEQGRESVQNFAWNEIAELTATYVLFPENPIIILKPKPGIDKKKIEFMMFGISLDLLRDILSRLPSDTKIYLYLYLEKMLKRKPDSKRKIIIIVILLIIIVIAGFLFSWYLIK